MAKQGKFRMDADLKHKNDQSTPILRGGPFPVSITLCFQTTRTHYTELILLTNLAGLKQAPLLKRVRDILLCFYQRGVKCLDRKKMK